ncbi:hypothetical protein DUNSADRAFT_6739 [Dunaliella salina]|uniref:PBP domain-containing protein n=1 Tax=Dunaliella salina TaxID=3046 RepID=A0ABQ7H6K8_DUNSA|nr:hypothetical protein DUNSADRAFT_6739 [Dunaliella salina]|eukprot:KAF5842495.1 hypothetical protein DUNSADRAFT_6739 [Dunaliella salina]
MRLEPAVWALLFLGLCSICYGMETVVLPFVGPFDGSNEYGGKITTSAEYGSSRPVDINFREVPTNADAKSEFMKGGKGALMSKPLDDTGYMNIPVAYSSLSIYVNIPGLRKSLNMSACTADEILRGNIENWDTPQITNANPDLPFVREKPAIIIVKQADETLHETTMLKDTLWNLFPDKHMPDASLDNQVVAKRCIGHLLVGRQIPEGVKYVCMYMYVYI